MMIPVLDRNTLDHLAIIVIYNVKINTKSAFGGLVLHVDTHS
jgi:hypothetical protein